MNNPRCIWKNCSKNYEGICEKSHRCSYGRQTEFPHIEVQPVILGQFSTLDYAKVAVYLYFDGKSTNEAVAIARDMLDRKVDITEQLRCLHG